MPTSARYALRLMIDLAEHGRTGEPVILRDIANRQNISQRYLAQLTTGLRNANLLVVSAGRGGGYFLRRAPESIRVGDIVRAVLGDLNVVECVADPVLCTRAEKCPSRQLWCELSAQLNAVLNRVTLADLIANRPTGHEAQSFGGLCPVSETINGSRYSEDPN